MRRTRGAKDELVEELRNRVRSVERRLDEAEASRRRADHIIAQLTRTTEEQARAIRELEAPVDEPEKDRRRSTGDRVSDPDAQQRVRTSGKPPKVGDLGLPKQTAFTSLVPLPAGYRLRFDPEADPELYPGAKDADGLESSPVPPDLLLNAGRVQDGLLIMLLGAGVLLATGATALDLLVTPATILGGGSCHLHLEVACDCRLWLLCRDESHRSARQTRFLDDIAHHRLRDGRVCRGDGSLTFEDRRVLKRGRF